MTDPALPLSTLGQPPRPRTLGAVNWVGLAALFRKEVRRFLIVYQQTLLAPVVTTLLFFGVFAVALGGQSAQAAAGPNGLPFLDFLAPGLVMMAMAQNAFANTSSSIVVAKVQGTIVDVLMPPLTAGEKLIAYVGGAVTRSLLVGIVSIVAVLPFADLTFPHIGLALYHGIVGSAIMALIGVIGALWADKFDHIAAVTNFIVTPLTFLSGTFYSVDRLQGSWQLVAHLNPFFYMIDGFREGLVGGSGVETATGLWVTALTAIVLALLAYRAFATGWRVKP